MVSAVLSDIGQWSSLIGFVALSLLAALLTFAPKAVIVPIYLNKRLEIALMMAIAAGARASDFLHQPVLSTGARVSNAVVAALTAGMTLYRVLKARHELQR